MAKAEKNAAAAVPQKKNAIPAGMVRVTNRKNEPYELAFVTLGKNFRLEPRGQKGDSILLDERLARHSDFKSASDYVVVG